MKFKAYSLVEILVASMIFMLVIVVSITAFGMVKRANMKADDLRLTNQCARQIEDYVGSQVRSANSGSRIMAIDKTASGYVFRDLPDGFKSFPGIVIFKDQTNYLAIYKQGGSYYTRDSSFTDVQQVKNGKIITFDPSADSALLPSECSAFTDTVEKYFLSDELVNPFQGRKTGRDKNTIEVVLKDAFYRKDVETQKISLENKSFSNVFLRVSNNVNNL